MNIALTKSEITGKLLAIVFAIACCVGHFYYNDATLIYNCCLLVCAILLVRSVKHKYLFLFACFVSTYILFLYPYFINNLSIGIYYEISGPSSYQKAIFLFSIFFMVPPLSHKVVLSSTIDSSVLVSQTIKNHTSQFM